MLFILFALFIVMPIIEIVVLLQVGSLIGTWPTLAIMLISALLGAKLLRAEGITTWMRVRQQAASGQLPGVQIVEGLLLFVAGVLMITPGFITDGLGLLMLLAPLRQRVASALLKRFAGHVVMGSSAVYHGAHRQTDSAPPFAHSPSRSYAGSDDVIEGEYERVDRS